MFTLKVLKVAVSLALTPTTICVVLAAPGYPEATRTGQAISGIERAAALAGVSVQHAGTAVRDGQLVVAGGRVLDVTATAQTLTLANDSATDQRQCHFSNAGRNHQAAKQTCGGKDQEDAHGSEISD